MSEFWFGIDGESFPFGGFDTRAEALAAAIQKFEPNPGAVIYIAEVVTITPATLES